MKIMTYNILRGGQPMAAGVNRLDFILNVIACGEPDILALQEANGFTSKLLRKKFSDVLSLPFHAISRGSLYEDSERYHVAVFSRYPIDQIYRFPKCQFQSAAISMKVETPIGEISICNVHLHAFSEKHRIKELQCILTHQKKTDKQVILGDLNSISHRDSYSSDVTEFELSYDVTDMLDKEMVDVGGQNKVENLWTHPSQLVADHTRKVPRRIDYVYVSSSLSERVVGIEAIQSIPTHLASDHFPVLVEFI